MDKEELWDKLYKDGWEEQVLSQLNDKEKEIYFARKDYVLQDNDVFFNPHQRIVVGIIKGLYKNLINYGAEYCPCRPVSGDPIEDAKNICPCIYHKDELKNDGICKCLLFVSSEWLKKKGYL